MIVKLLTKVSKLSYFGGLTP